MQQPLIHPDETGRGYYAALALSAVNTPWMASGLLTEEGYRAAMRKYGSRGYGLRRLNVLLTRDGIRYAAIWQFGHPVATRERHGMTEAEFRAQVTASPQVLAHVDAAATPAGPQFAAIWEEKTGPAQKVTAGLSTAEFDLQRATLTGEGYRLRQLAGYADNGSARFVAVFEQGTGRRQEIFAAVPAEDFAVLSRSMTRCGLLLRDASGYVVGDAAYHTAIWEG
ncbi:MAG: hypothetical protein ISS15_11770 [Alphaproteobacteria bacterium]|nr:hypothetical protein [Alphaproteobacteria bacterium]